MVDFRSALASRLKPEAISAQGNAGVTINETLVVAMGQITGWADFETAAAPALSLLGVDGLGNYKTVQTGEDCVTYRTAPDRILIRHSEPEVLTKALAAVDRSIGTALELSHSRCCISLCGPSVEDLLSRVATLDFQIDAFPVGNFAQTDIHHVAVLIHRIASDHFDLLVPYTWAVSTFDFLSDNALCGGLHPGEKTQ